MKAPANPHPSGCSGIRSRRARALALPWPDARGRLLAALALTAGVLALGVIAVQAAFADASHADRPNDRASMMQGEQGSGMMSRGMIGPGMMGEGMMGEGMLMMPPMDPARGRRLFAEKGCVVCHSVNGIGGEDTDPVDASGMQPMMNPFEFAARMWRGAEAMVVMQRETLGGQIELTGQDLADLIAFAHSHAEQRKFSADDIPEEIRELIAHEHDEGARHE